MRHRLVELGVGGSLVRSISFCRNNPIFLIALAIIPFVFGVANSVVIDYFTPAPVVVAEKQTESSLESIRESRVPVSVIVAVILVSVLVQ